jgi:hypothetical protein
MHPGLAEPRTKEEWRGYLAMLPPRRPVLPPHGTYKDMSEDQREEFDEQRHEHHSSLVIVRTEQMKKIHRTIDRRMRVNARQAPGARRGIVLDGHATIGKSTLVKFFAADHERRLRRRHPERFKARYIVENNIVDYIPVVYLNIPSQATPKDLSTQLAEYLGVHYRTGSTKNALTVRVLEEMRLCGTELVIIDDVHFLDLSAKEGRVTNDHLKYLANHTAATFIYTGADLNTSGLFLEGTGSTRATQTSGRNTLVKMTGFETKTEARRQEWVSVIRAMEECLVLYRHKPGGLVKLWAYLYDRTGGSICALSDLIRESAIEAVLSEDEAITRRLMDEIDISELAQRHYKQTKKKPKDKPENSL